MRWLVLFLLLALPISVGAQTAPTISGVTAPSSIGKYGKFEITFQINNFSGNPNLPFDANPPPGVNENGITVNAIFTSPSGTTSTQPAFYYQEFSSEQRNNKDWIYPSGSFNWKVRFAPPQTGTWQYRLEVNGISQSPVASFTVTNSASKGFVRVSPNDPRYFEYEDGTYFPAQGFNFNPNKNDIDANADQFQLFATNGIQLARTWLSNWSIFGSQWNPWNAMPTDYEGYLPRTGLEAVDGFFRLKLSYRASNPNNPSCTDNCSFWKASRFIGWESPQASVKPNTNYRIRVRYRTQNVAGPRLAQHPNFGLVAKITTTWLNTPHNANTDPAGIWKSNYGSATDWSEITGTWNSGSNNYLPYLYLALENVTDPGAGLPAAVAYVDHVWVEEVMGSGQFGPNIIPKPDMDHHTYFDQRGSFAFDRLVELAEQNNVYLRPVILEKDEYIQNHIDFSGVLRTDDLANLFYGNGRTMTAVRWYQQAWWRYLQARWGYSTAIHSWELVNEGNPTFQNHYILTDELGKYMRTFAPNHHMVSTSNWHSFPANLWSAQPNIDFADVHYYQPRSATSELNDTVLATLNRSLAYGANRPGGAGKPVIRGETGFVETGSSPSIRDLDADIQGLWLHNFIWAGINYGGLIESYWYVGGPDGQINNSITGRDHRPTYGRYYRFIRDIPLSNGSYVDASAVSSTPNLRVLGQKDLVNKRAHLWINNINNTWKNVVDGITIAPVTGTVTVTGFTPNTVYPLEWWDTYTGQVSDIEGQMTNGAGDLVLDISNLATDTAVKIGDYSDTPVTRQQLLQNWLSATHDQNGDNKVNSLDFGLLQ